MLISSRHESAQIDSEDWLRSTSDDEESSCEQNAVRPFSSEQEESICDWNTVFFSTCDKEKSIFTETLYPFPLAKMKNPFAVQSQYIQKQNQAILGFSHSP